jgi:hypothetical protein
MRCLPQADVETVCSCHIMVRIAYHKSGVGVGERESSMHSASLFSSSSPYPLTLSLSLSISILVRHWPNGTSLDFLTAASASTRGPVQGSQGIQFCPPLSADAPTAKQHIARPSDRRVGFHPWTHPGFSARAPNSAHRSVLVRLLPNCISLDFLTAASASTRGTRPGFPGHRILPTAQHRGIYCQKALRSTF